MISTYWPQSFLSLDQKNSSFDITLFLLLYNQECWLMEFFISLIYYIFYLKQTNKNTKPNENQWIYKKIA